ncbi:hypothetical protein D3C87_835510 [compost metagenome]
MDDRSGQIVTENEGWTIGQEQLEFAVAHLGIQKIDRGGLNANQHIIGADDGIGHIGQTQRGLFLVFVYDEGFHEGLQCETMIMSGSQESQGFRHEFSMVLEDAAMASICVDQQSALGIR